MPACSDPTQRFECRPYGPPWRLRPARRDADDSDQARRGVIERTWGWDDDWQVKDFDRRISAYQAFVIDAGQEPIGGPMLDPTPDNLDIVETERYWDVGPTREASLRATWVLCDWFIRMRYTPPG